MCKHRRPRAEMIEVAERIDTHNARARRSRSTVSVFKVLRACGVHCGRFPRAHWRVSAFERALCALALQSSSAYCVERRCGDRNSRNASLRVPPVRARGCGRAVWTASAVAACAVRARIRPEPGPRVNPRDSDPRTVEQTDNRRDMRECVARGSTGRCNDSCESRVRRAPQHGSAEVRQACRRQATRAHAPASHDPASGSAMSPARQ